jgi:quinoprotein glucose dehydrogenase
MRNIELRSSILSSLTVVCLLGTPAVDAQQGARDGEWRSYAGEVGGTKYSPLDQIDAVNVQELRVAWRWRSVDHELADADPELQFNPTLQATPLMIDGRLFMSTNLGQGVAIDPATGNTTWVYRALEDGAGRPRGGSTRGVAYWHDPDRDDERIFIASGEQLVALDAKTGQPLPEFGAGGKVNLREGIPRLEEFRWTAAPLVCRDTIIVGIFTLDKPDDKEQVPGYIRGFDAVTGQLKWVFNTIPRPGEFGHETWENGSWEYTGSTNVWTTMSADEELGYAYLPTATPTHNWYGGHRLGDNLFAESLLCLECETGRRVWHQQLVHHGVWDYDTASTPILADITVDGQPIKAVAQVTKQAFTYVFDRVTGEPVWPIEERPVPQSDVPGERTSPTQPFPTRPAPFDRQGITTDDLIDFTPELRAEALEIFNRYRSGPIYTPPSLRDESPGGTLGTLQLPSWVGGVNWNGAAYDPETQRLYVPSITVPIQIWLREADPDVSAFRYIQGSNNLWIDGPQGLPLVKPPWGRITAIDLNTGEHVWMTPNGPGPRDHLALQDLALPWLGNPGRAAPLLTKTLLFLGEGSPSMQVVPPHGGGRMFRAYDKNSGAVLWQTELPAGTSGAPMTYLHDGKQYIVVAVSDRDHEGELVAFTLP